MSLDKPLGFLYLWVTTSELEQDIKRVIKQLVKILRERHIQFGAR